MEKLILSKKESKLINSFLEYYIGKLKRQDYHLSEDFIGTPDDVMKKYHIGMGFMVEQMQHELRGFQTRKEYNESIENNNRIIN